MAADRLEELGEEELIEHRLGLIRAYDEACAACDRQKVAWLHWQIRTADREFQRRQGDSYPWTGLEALSIDQLVDTFVKRAFAYDKADGMPEVETRYWELDAVTTELGRRERDQRRALFKLYFHPDERVHHAAAEATRSLAPVLSVDRMRAVGDPTWSPPESGPGAYEAKLHGVVANRPGKKKRAAPLEDQSVDDLVDLFLGLSIEMDEAQRFDEIGRYKRLFSREYAVLDEFKRREGDQRRLLTRFYDHPNFKVRLNAAHATLAIFPGEARQVFESIAQSGWKDYAFYARSTLGNLDTGIYKPT
jgi:hypothetical protein